MISLINTTDQFASSINSPLCVVLFTADFAEQCKVIKEGLNELSKKKELLSTKFCELYAEELAEVSLKYGIDAVPTTLFFKNGQKIDQVDGANIAEISSKVHKYADSATSLSNDCTPADIEARLKELINQHKVMVFMKGDRTTPRCGFSKTLIGILNETGVEYGTFDILTDEVVRQELKTFSEWPTYPQLYVKGDLIGGLDIVKELVEGNELKDVLNG